MASLVFIQRRFLTKEKKSIFKNIFSEKGGYTLHSHIVQIGDPILRLPTQTVEKSAIKSESIQQTIRTLKEVIKKYDAVGLSAPQIGVPLKIICVQMTRKQLDVWDPQTIKDRGMEAFRQKILINPESKVVNFEIELHREGCCSVNGFSGRVPRPKEIVVKALTEEGEEVNFSAKNWTARIIQHEIDHLNGHLFTDTAVPESLMFEYWETVNNRKGQFSLTYAGLETLKKWKLLFFPSFLFKQRRN